MFESPQFFEALVMRGPMNQDQLQRDQVRTELDNIRTEVERLKMRSAENGSEDTSRFDRYLDTLDEKREEVAENLDSLKESGAEAWTDIKKGMKEAKQRLAIAKVAAKSRFH
jgi:hypothetical protein